MEHMDGQALTLQLLLTLLKVPGSRLPPKVDAVDLLISSLTFANAAFTSEIRPFYLHAQSYNLRKREKRRDI